MATESVRVFDVMPTTPERVYQAWLNSAEHTSMTGGKATVDPATGAFTAWDGYIRGMTLEADPGRRIVQSWRSSEFPEGASDSRIEVILEVVEGGTRITLIHSEIPEGQGSQYEQGWQDHYFIPMKRHFVASSAPAPKATPAKVEAQPAAKKPAAKKPAARKATRKPAARKAAKAKKPAARKAAKAKKPAARKAAKAKKPAARKAAKAKKPAARKAARKPAARKTARKPARKSRR